MTYISGITVSRDKVERALTRNRMSYNMLFEDSHISRSHFYYVINGKRSPTLHTVSQLCRALDVSDINEIVEVSLDDSKKRS